MYQIEKAGTIKNMGVHIDDIFYRLSMYHCLSVSASFLRGWKLNRSQITWYFTVSITYEMKSCIMTINVFDGTDIFNVGCRVKQVSSSLYMVSNWCVCGYTNLPLHCYPNIFVTLTKLNCPVTHII